jgi:phosphatidylinositol-3-phosphatase
MAKSFSRRLRGGFFQALLIGTLLSGGFLISAKAQITTVFYILLENRCWTTGTDTSYNNIIKGNSAAPYLNSITTPNNAAAAQVSYCSAYHNDISYTSGSNELNVAGGVHPSEPNYVWMEAGSNLSKFDDNDPYGTTNSVAQIASYLAANPSYTGESLSALLQNNGITWKAYVEGTCLLNSGGLDYDSKTTSGGTLTNNIAPAGTRTMPLVSFSGSPSTYTNEYNGTHQFNFAVKHTGSLFFPATNGSTVSTANTSATNVEISHYGPLEELTTDLNNNTVAQYNVITPDQYNDGHTALSTNFSYNGQTYIAGNDNERIAQMDNFCSIVVPQIQNSTNYKAGHTAIVIWTDETEGTPQDDFYHTLTEIVISPFCKGNAYASTLNMTHSSDIATMQELFGVVANTPTGYLNDAANFSNATQGTPLNYNGSNGFAGQAASGSAFPGFGTGTTQDMSDLFTAGTIPSGLPGLSLTPSGYAFNRHTNADSQTVTVTNVLTQPITGPIYLVLGNLSSNTSLTNKTGTTVNSKPGSSYITVSSNGLAAGASTTVTLQFTAPTSGVISDDLATLVTTGTP